MGSLLLAVTGRERLGGTFLGLWPSVRTADRKSEPQIRNLT